MLCDDYICDDYIVEAASRDVVAALSDSPFEALRRLLAGVKVRSSATPIDMSIGEPKTRMPTFVAPSLSADNPGWSRYPPARGIPEWIEAVSLWAQKRYGLDADFLPRHATLLPLCGSREGLFLAALYAIWRKRQGGETSPLVAFPSPMYHVYYGSAVLGGCDTLAVNNQGTASAWVQKIVNLPPHLAQRLAVLFVCNPDNPSGNIFSGDDLQALSAHARRHNYMLIADECYSEIYFDDKPVGLLDLLRQTQQTQHDTCLANVIIINSLSKRSSAAGLRSGFLIAAQNTATEILNLRNYVSAIPPIPAQQAAAKLWADKAHVEPLRQHYRALRQIATEILGDYRGFRSPQGGFFLWLGTPNATATTRLLWQEAAVKTLPGSYMCRADKHGKSAGDTYIRIAMLHAKDIFADALQRIRPLLTNP